MSHYFQKRSRVIQLCLVLSLLIGYTIAPNNRIEAAATAASKKPTATIASNVQAILYDAQLVTQEQGKLAAFTVAIQNDSSSSLQLLDYWAKIKSKSGKTYPTKLKEADKTKVTAPSKGTTYLTYYASVDNQTKLADLSIDLIKWDFSSSNYESKLGTLNASGTGATASYGVREMLFGNNKLKGQVKQYTLYKDSQYGYLTVDYSIENLSLSSVDLTPVNYFAQIDGGSVFAFDKNTSNITLKARETKMITLSVAIPLKNLSSKFSLVLSTTEEQSKTNLPIGVFDLPALKPTVAVKPNVTKALYLGGNTLNITAGDSFVSLAANHEQLSTQFVLENTGSTKLPLPALEFYLKTKEGYLYPLTRDSDAEVVLLPKIKQSIQLSGQIPSSSILKTSEIVVFYKNGGEDSKSSFLSNFAVAVKTATGEQSSAVAQYNGYEVRQESIQRTPNDLTDLVVAEFTLKNTTAQAKSKLLLGGHFIVDGVKIDPSKSTIVVLDDVTTVGPNQSYKVVAYTEVPYTQVISKIEFVMLETDAEKKNEKQIHIFSVESPTQAKELGSNEAYNITSLGKRAEVRFVKSALYSGTSSDFFYAEVEYTNKERRAINPAQLAGYIQNQNDSIIDLTFSEYKEKVMPNGKVVISAWTKVPRNFEKETISFYFGESFKLANDAGSAVVKPVFTDYAIKEIAVQKNLKKIGFMNNALDIRYVVATMHASDGYAIDSVKVSFEYDLVESEDADRAFAEEHKLIFEFVDNDYNDIAFTKELTLGKDNNKDELVVGKKLQKEFVFQNQLVTHKNEYAKGFTINIYDSFQGFKTLIASQNMQWGTVND
ncbi:hypothetical protein D3P07_20700 [Paenibacillus sp. 1011MAR3C5]|uniref:hypothetical protein n=1 Tax=Paenibacillus sp. 1011MAR3C5 TaxID=1675787 RepID=UPI000E6D50C7|nr:hypothetical protein [Paenibacillus sp. 1011MAR3C5]RJE85618.1 hypothetical protein D3P07_20700 [Paenibacillus sp. 1011MAR3C5]